MKAGSFFGCLAIVLVHTEVLIFSVQLQRPVPCGLPPPPYDEAQDVRVRRCAQDVRAFSVISQHRFAYAHRVSFIAH